MVQVELTDEQVKLVYRALKEFTDIIWDDTEIIRRELDTPNNSKNKNVFVIDVKDSGQGCGYAIKIPGLYNNAEPLTAGKTITMEFTPTTPGSYDITCGMNMIRFGSIIVE